MPGLVSLLSLASFYRWMPFALFLRLAGLRSGTTTSEILCSFSLKLESAHDIPSQMWEQMWFAFERGWTLSHKINVISRLTGDRGRLPAGQSRLMLPRSFKGAQAHAQLYPRACRGRHDRGDRARHARPQPVRAVARALAAQAGRADAVGAGGSRPVGLVLGDAAAVPTRGRGGRAAVVDDSLCVAPQFDRARLARRPADPSGRRSPRHLGRDDRAALFPLHN